MKIIVRTTTTPTIRVTVTTREGPRTDEERAKAHHGLSDEDWAALSQKAKTALIAALPPRGSAETERAVWTTKYINDLPDSSFLYIESGGEKDSEGKTTPRNKRHFPVKNAEGKVDASHARNAIGRIPQSNAPGLTTEKKATLQDKARELLASVTRSGQRVLRADEKLQILYVMAYEADDENPIKDAHDTHADEATVERWCHEWMRDSRAFNLNHRGQDIEVVPVECWIERSGIFHQTGEVLGKAAWIVGGFVSDKDAFEHFERACTGVSIEGFPVPQGG